MLGTRSLGTKPNMAWVFDDATRGNCPAWSQECANQCHCFRPEGDSGSPDPLEQGSSWTLGSKCIAAGGQCVMPAMAALAALDRNLCNLCRPRHILSTSRGV